MLRLPFRERPLIPVFPHIAASLKSNLLFILTINFPLGFLVRINDPLIFFFFFATKD